LSAYIDRVVTHIAQLQNLPSGLVTFGRHFATGRYEEIDIGSTNRDAFGLRKFIVVATEAGKIFALDSSNKGNIVWTHFFEIGSKIHGMWILRESSAVRGKPPLIGVVVEKEGIYSFRQMDGLSGKIVESEKFYEDSIDKIVKTFVVPGIADIDGRRCVVIVTKRGISKALPSTTDVHLVSAKISNKLFYSVQESDALQGYTFDSVCYDTYVAYIRCSTLSLPGDLKSLPVAG